MFLSLIVEWRTFTRLYPSGAVDKPIRSVSESHQRRFYYMPLTSLDRQFTFYRIGKDTISRLTSRIPQKRRVGLDFIMRYQNQPVAFLSVQIKYKEEHTDIQGRLYTAKTSYTTCFLFGVNAMDCYHLINGFHSTQNKRRINGVPRLSWDTLGPLFSYFWNFWTQK